MNMKFHAPFLSSVLALLLSSAAATDIAEVVAAQHIAKIFNARCAAAGGHGTKTGMIPWVGKLGGTSSRYVFNIGPENDCNIGLTESELWTSNLTDAGTFRIKGAPPTVSGEQPAVLTAVHKLLYVAGDDASGEELWVSDGTAEGTMLLKDVRSGPEGSGTSMLMACGTLVYFGADDGVHGRELWASDGTAEGTRLVADLSKGAASSVLSIGECNTGQLFFGLGEGDAQQRFTSDGTAEGTKVAPETPKVEL